MKRDSAPDKKHDHDYKHQKAVLEREVYQLLNHCASRVASNWSTFETTGCPAAMPERSSCLLPGSMFPVCTSTRLNCFPPAGMKTQSRSCRCSTAGAGTTACTSLFLLSNVAVTNMPSLRIPGFG